MVDQVQSFERRFLARVKALAQKQTTHDLARSADFLQSEFAVTGLAQAAEVMRGQRPKGHPTGEGFLRRLLLAQG